MLDSDGGQITFDDDSGAGSESRIVYTPTSSGIYYLSAEAYHNLYTGTYLLSARQETVPNDFNGDAKSDILWQNTNGATTIWQMNGTGATPGPVYNVDPSRHAIGTATSTATASRDILWQNTSDATDDLADGRQHRDARSCLTL